MPRASAPRTQFWRHAVVTLYEPGTNGALEHHRRSTTERLNPQVFTGLLGLWAVRGGNPRHPACKAWAWPVRCGSGAATPGKYWGVATAAGRLGGGTRAPEASTKLPSNRIGG